MSTKKRWPRGTWMTLISTETLLAIMRQKDFTNARLARYVGCSRQFIWQLLKADGKKKTMKPLTAELIAEALDVPVSVLFVPSSSIAADRIVKHRAKVAA